MYVLVTYDVSTTDSGGIRRLSRVAKICTRYGQRVQNSVFECLVDPAQFETLRHDLLSVINEKSDSLRFYNLGKHWKSRVEHIGAKDTYDPEGVLIM